MKHSQSFTVLLKLRHALTYIIQCPCFLFLEVESPHGFNIVPNLKGTFLVFVKINELFFIKRINNNYVRGYSF